MQSLAVSARPSAYQQLSTAEKIGINIQIKMRKQGLTHDDLSIKMRLTRSAITKRLSGQTKIEAAELSFIADFLRCDVSELMP